jgi:hypothetical protein
VAQKRPSYVSIRARQKNIIEGLGTSDLKYAQAAKRFGVEPRELRKFAETKPKTLRRNFNRSPVYKKLYAEGARSEVREKLGVRRIKHYAIREKELRQLPYARKYTESETTRRRQIGELLQNLYVSDELSRYRWASYVREHDLPTSIAALQLLHRNDRISDSEYQRALSDWRAIYNISDQHYSKFADELSEYDEVA